MANNKDSICKQCNSYSYCANRTSGVTACINFNKFPKPSADEAKK